MAGKQPARPPFIVSAADVEETTHVYQGTDEPMSPKRAIGHAAGLLKIGLHLVRVLPGTRTSLPHAEEGEEEFAYVIRGEVNCWSDGHLHRMREGDLVAWPAGTGIAHTIINDGDEEALLLAGGEKDVPGAKIIYPLNPERRDHRRWSEWWVDAPKRKLGPHDGLPAARRGRSRRRA